MGKKTQDEDPKREINPSPRSGAGIARRYWASRRVQDGDIEALPGGAPGDLAVAVEVMRNTPRQQRTS